MTERPLIAHRAPARTALSTCIAQSGRRPESAQSGQSEAGSRPSIASQPQAWVGTRDGEGGACEDGRSRGRKGKRRREDKRKAVEYKCGFTDRGWSP
eukprot:3862481-Rhodomonas_salina.1